MFPAVKIGFIEVPSKFHGIAIYDKYGFPIFLLPNDKLTGARAEASNL
jgi:hypothetical protein